MDADLIEAIKKDDFDAVKMLLPKNTIYDPVAAAKYFAVAVNYERFRVAELIINQISEVKYDNGSTALHLASSTTEGSNVSFMEALIAANLQLCFEKDNSSYIPLHLAIMHGHIEAARVLCSSCPDSMKVTTRDDDTALHLALKYQKHEGFAALMEQVKKHGLENDVLNFKNNEGNTVFHIAASSGQKEVLDLINSITVNIAANAPEIQHNGGGVSSFSVETSNTDGTTDGRSSEAKNVLLAVLVMVAASTFATAYSMSSSLGEVKCRPFLFKDVASLKLPAAFYVSVFNTAGFVISMGTIANLLLSFPYWVVNLFLLVMVSFVYFIMINKPLGNCSVRFGSMKIALFILMWIFFPLVIAVGMAAIKFFPGLYRKLINWIKGGFQHRLSRLEHG